MVEMIAIKLTVEQVRRLRDVVVNAAIDAQRIAVTTTSKKARDIYNARAARMNELADIFNKTCP